MDKQKLYHLHSSNKTTIYDKINNHINSRYDLVYNEVSQKFYIRLKDKPGWTKLVFESIKVELNKSEIKMSDSTLETFLSSYLVRKIDPFKEYFSELPVWDGKDHIKDLCSYITTDDDDLFYYHFKKWFVRAVKCALEEDYYNKNCLVLAQEAENSGKTTFCRFICPPQLKNYYVENIGYDKDGQIQLTKNILTILDEIDKIDPRSMNAYKSFLSKTHINLRLPYAKTNSNRSRSCSFIGTTNLLNFLKESDGSVRWICFEIIGYINFDYSKNIDIDKVWAQAYHLAYTDKTFNPDLTREDVILNKQRNERHRNISVEEELINEHFEASIDRSACMTATQVTRILKNYFPQANIISTGRELKKMGYKRINDPNTGAKSYMIQFRNR